jgi:hypothetical protein
MRSSKKSPLGEPDKGPLKTKMESSKDYNKTLKMRLKGRNNPIKIEYFLLILLS